MALLAGGADDTLSSSIDIRSLSFAVALGRGAPSLVFGVAVI